MSDSGPKTYQIFLKEAGMVNVSAGRIELTNRTLDLWEDEYNKVLVAQFLVEDVVGWKFKQD